MIRIIVEQLDDSHVAAGVADEGIKTFKTFDVELPEVEAWLTHDNSNGYITRRFIGIELSGGTHDAIDAGR